MAKLASTRALFRLGRGHRGLLEGNYRGSTQTQRNPLALNLFLMFFSYLGPEYVA